MGEGGAERQAVILVPDDFDRGDNRA